MAHSMALHANKQTNSVALVDGERKKKKQKELQEHIAAFVGTYPAGPLDGGIVDPATALPVQVYAWASRSDPAFIERSSGAIIVLLGFLLIMNLLVILLRRRFERRW